MYHFNGDLYVRPLRPGMGEAVAKRTFLRKRCGCGWMGWGSQEVCPQCGTGLGEATFETWGDLATRVALGNSLLHPSGRGDLLQLERDIASGLILMSGRHLQHGDETQPSRSQEVFTNCATACTSFMKFYLLLSGSGVGRCYDDDLMIVDWALAPQIACVLDRSHPDYEERWDESRVQCKNGFVHHVVEDSREGWARAVELYETMAYRGLRDQTLILDFSKVRPRGAPIRGMQGRPSAGPVPTMIAIAAIADKVVAGARRNPEHWVPWRQNMYVDHLLADCVHLGGARRAARCATKHWRDPGIFDYIRLKHAGDTWTSNNSVGKDHEFYEALKNADHPDHAHAKAVASAISTANYRGNAAGKEKGEPGVENEHKRDISYNDGRRYRVVGSEKFSPTPDGAALLRACQQVLARKRWIFMPNPCFEIHLWKGGGFCVVADVAPFHAPTLSSGAAVRRGALVHHKFRRAVQIEFEQAVRLTTRALIRVNLMPSVYRDEVRRTNRIGVSLTGLHEYAWAAFGLGFHDLLDEHGAGAPFWQSIGAAKRAVQDEARCYSEELGVEVPHTNTTVKPSGSNSKPFGLSEGAHLPPYTHILRWVQYQANDPRVQRYESAGYPVRRNVRNYEDQALVGFPTRALIVGLGIGDKLVTAGQATMEEQYQWLRLLEKYWIVGVDKEGTPLEDRGNAVSYTLKYDPQRVSYEEFHKQMWENQGTVRCAAVMPQEDVSSYSYQPEEPISAERYDELMVHIWAQEEEVDDRTLACANGACPI